MLVAEGLLQDFQALWGGGRWVVVTENGVELMQSAPDHLKGILLVPLLLLLIAALTGAQIEECGQVRATNSH